VLPVTASRSAWIHRPLAGTINTTVNGMIGGIINTPVNDMILA
jgi:hypothetical protein